MTYPRFKSEILKTSAVNHARVLNIVTAHGSIKTPAFMPVGTRAFVNQLSPLDLKMTGTQIILGGNTYHMLLNPGVHVIRTQGGMHKLMGWDGPMLTDSGGYQIFSLTQAKLCHVDDKGAYFKNPLSNQSIALTPKSSIETQKILGADIMMAFDDCIAESSGREGIITAMQRTHQWLLEAKALHTNEPNSPYGYPQALFGIIQGGYYKDLREASAQFTQTLELDGFGIGGESIGPCRKQTCTILDWVRPLLPPHKVRYPMGVGLEPQDLIEVVAHGADIFDCVAPTRNARHGSLYCGEWEIKDQWIRFNKLEYNGRLLIKKSQYATDERPVMAQCQCLTCQNYSRAYLHFLFRQKSGLYYTLACIHNVHVMQETCHRMRECILSSDI